MEVAASSTELDWAKLSPAAASTNMMRVKATILKDVGWMDEIQKVDSVEK